MLRSNHYDLAFERFLRQQKLPYVAVDESKRAMMAETSLKSMDFIVYSSTGKNLLIDVKGRKTNGSRMLENWTTLDDVLSLRQWESVFGNGFRSMLVFAYPAESDSEQGVPPSSAIDERSTVEFRGSRYSFYGVWVDRFQESMMMRSNQWQTVWLRKHEFQSLRKPISTFLF